MEAIKNSVRALQQSNYSDAQAHLDPILQNPSSSAFKQAVVLQFTLLEKQYQAGLINCEGYFAERSAKAKDLLAMNLEDESVIDYLKEHYEILSR